MIPLLVLAGLYVILWLPIIGHLLQDGIMHLALHALEHEWFLSAVCLFLPVTLVFVAAAMIAQWWYLAGDAALVLLILASLFGTFSNH